MNILITSAGRRVSLVKAFKKELIKIFPDGKIFTVDMKPELSSACQVSDGFFSVPKATDPAYCKKLTEICKENNIKLLIPTIDTELIVLSENIEYFKNNGIEPVVSSIDVMLMCRDKRKTHRYFDSMDFPHAKEIDIQNPVFPIFGKPYDGSSSVGAKVIKDNTQLSESLIMDQKMMFLEYLNPDEYAECTVDMYFDKKHFLKCAVPRERIEVRTGEVSKGVTRRGDIYNLVCKKFEYCPGFIGCITLQIFKKKNSTEVLGIEINPRFGGGYPLSYLANANFPDMIIKEYLCGESIPFLDGWIENLLMLRYDDEVLVYDYRG
jgi:carbamoyl-phosphate synthase large subunit